MKTRSHFRRVNIFFIFVFLVIAIWASRMVFFTRVAPNFLTLTQNNNNEVSQKVESLIFKGSIPYWDQDHAFSSFQTNVNSFGYVNLFWYYMDETGNVNKYKDANVDANIVNYAHSNNVKVIAVITNLGDFSGSSWDSGRVEKVIGNQDTEQKHIQNIVELALSNNFDGVTVDYEQIDKGQRQQFSNFIRDLSESMHKNGKIVVVALHPKETSGDDKNGIGAFQDWQELVKYADQLNIMAYDEHYDEGSAGPVASYGWDEQIVQYTRNLKVPLQKFFLGMPLYGYEWNHDNNDAAKGLTFKDVQKILSANDISEQWDANARSPYFKFKKDGDNMEVWFENARSINEKIKLAKDAGFGGVNFWRLGEEDPTLWKSISN